MNADKRHEITANLDALFDGLYKGRYLLSAQRIAHILRYFASEPELMRILADCNKNFNFDSEFERAAGAGGVFFLPEKDDRITALITGLLFKFDRKQLDFHAFITKFFPAASANDEFKKFCAYVIEPYKLALFSLLDTEEPVPEEIPYKEEKNSLDERVKAQIMPLIESISHEILRSGLSAKQRKDCITLMEGFFYAADELNERMVKALWVGIKHVLSGYKFLSPYLKSLQEILDMYF